MSDSTPAGHGRHTPAKQEQYRDIVSMHLKIVQSIMRRRSEAYPRYVYLDLNAGPGVVNGIEGSPLNFVKAAHRLEVPFEAWMFERDPQSARDLDTRMDPFCRMSFADIRVIPGDRAASFERVLNFYSHLRGKRAYGLAYADPNGIDLALPEFRQLRDMPCFRYLDFLAYVGATSFKRVRGVHDRPELVLSDLLHSVGKRFVHLRAPVGQNQWTFAILTDWKDFPDLQAAGFHRIDSPVGREIQRRLDLTADEFREASNIALPFAQGRSTRPTRSTSGIPGSSLSARKSCNGPAASVSGASSDHQLSLTI